MTTRYRANREAILQETFQNRDILPLSETFARGAIENLFAEGTCEGLRIYYGMDEEEKVHAIIVGVNEDNEDILPASLSIVENEPVIIEEGQRCPPSCPPASDLNS
ncbi:MAG: hypothetical protein H7Y86_04230 [Rhizobacter sp.]|nr:hypothetical protein [Ferruginibacter sp.]